MCAPCAKPLSDNTSLNNGAEVLGDLVQGPTIAQALLAQTRAKVTRWRARNISQSNGYAEDYPYLKNNCLKKVFIGPKLPAMEVFIKDNLLL